MAPDAEAAKVLGDSAQLPESKTVASFLLQHKSSQNELWIVDEAGKLNSKDMLQLLERARDQKARVVFVGDTRQLAAVEAGNPFRALQKQGIMTAHLTEHRRQKDQELRRAVEKLAHGDVRGGMGHLSDSSHFIAEDSKRSRQIIKEYLALIPEKRESTLVLCGTNAERSTITEGIRERLKKSGHLGQETAAQVYKQKDLTKEQSYSIHRYDLGDIVHFRENKNGLRSGTNYSVVKAEGRTAILRDEKGREVKFDPRTDIQRSVFQSRAMNLAVGDLVKWTKNEGTRRNGQTLKVQSIEGGQVFLVNEKSERVVINRDEKQFLDHAYVHTVFSSQGKTCDHVIASVDHTYNKKALYVALSRAKSSVSLYAKDHDSVVSLEEKKAEKLNAMDLVPVAAAGQGQGREVKMSIW
jgi:ATP-dependent exoDNAse (exonuclease V) alpha subunit